MQQQIRFAINRISASTLPFAAFAAMAQRLGVKAIEIRNDLAGVEMQDGTPAREIAAAAQAHGLSVVSINALQRFEQYDAARNTEALALVRYAAACGAQALVLCPTNNPRDLRSPGQRHGDLTQSLRALQPLLADHGLTGLIEALGFGECALRRKSQAVRALQEIGEQSTFALVHDTFHHHLAGDTAFFPELTGLVHVSGIEDASLEVPQMRDGHRVLVGPADRLDNIAQLRALLGAGYSGYVSFEPFAPEITSATDIEPRLARSMAYLSTAIGQSAGPAKAHPPGCRA